MQLGAALQYGRVGDTRIEPHVQRVGKFPVVRRLLAQQVHRVQAEPCLDAIALDQLGDLLQQFRRARMELHRLLVHEKRHRHAPVALARHAPVGAVFDHRFEAGAPPGGKEFGLFDGLVGEVAQARSIMLRPRRAMLAFFLHQIVHSQGLVLLSALRPLSSGIHPDEPLRRGAENDRRLVAPAMRITVLHFFQMQ